MDAIAEGGTAFHSIRARLTLEERNLGVLEEQQGRIKAEIAPDPPNRLQRTRAGGNSDVNFKVPGSIYRAIWLRRTDSNRRPGG